MVKDLEYYLSLEYEIKLKKLSQEEGSGWFAEIPLLLGCMSDDESLEEAVENLGNAKREWIEISLELERGISEPTIDEFSGQLRVRMPKSLHRIHQKRYS